MAANNLDNDSFAEILEQAAPEDLDSWQDISLSLLESLFGIWSAFVERLPYIFLGLTVILITWAVTALVNKAVLSAARRAKTRHSLAELFSRLATMAVWVIGLLLAAMVMFPGLTPSKALGGLGLISVAVGLAFKDIFENFFAGMLILWKFPFENGDFIECNGVMGRVEEVNIRMTKIRETSGELVVMPNATLFKNAVEVLTDQAVRRNRIEVGVAYGENVAAAVAVIQQTVESCHSLSGNRPVEVFPFAFGSSSIDIEVCWWSAPTPLAVRKSRAEVVTNIKSALDSAGIEIPFPYRTLTFKEPLSLHNNSQANDGAGDGENRPDE